jgi:hypothetical protein
MLELDQVPAEVADHRVDSRSGQDCRPVDDLQPVESRAQRRNLLIWLRRSHFDESSLRYRMMSEVIGPRPSLTLPQTLWRGAFVVASARPGSDCVSTTRGQSWARPHSHS